MHPRGFHRRGEKSHTRARVARAAHPVAGVDGASSGASDVRLARHRVARASGAVAAAAFAMSTRASAGRLVTHARAIVQRVRFERAVGDATRSVGRHDGARARAYAHASASTSVGANEGGTRDGARDGAWLAERKRWRFEVNAARRAWRSEREERAKATNEAETAARAVAATEKAERLAEKARARAARAGASAGAREERARLRERETRVIAGRRRQRAHAMSLRRQAREIDLLKASRGWIESTEELERRVQRAVERPERLFK